MGPIKTFLSRWRGQSESQAADDRAKSLSALALAFMRGEDIGGGGNRLSSPFAESVWVQRAIKKISQPITAVSLKFRRPGTEEEITDAPWLQFWKAPVRGMRLNEVIQATVGWLKLSGEAFFVLPPEMVSVRFVSSVKAWPQLTIVRPDRMRALLNSAGELEKWEVIGANGQRAQVSPQGVIQSKYWNPYNDVRGMSEYEAARVASESDYLNGRFALNLARANGDTGLIVSTEGGAPSDEQREQITQALRLKREKSLRGEFASVFLPSSIKVEDPKVKAPDAMFAATRLQNRHEIFLAFDVPPSMAEVMASYSVGSASDWYRLIVDACIPSGAMVAEVISQVASIQAGEPVEAYFDFDEHPVMQAVRRERIDAGVKLWSTGVPWRTASDYLDLDLPDFEGDKIGYLPFSVSPVGTERPTPDPVNDPSLEEPEAEMVSDAIREAFDGRSHAKTQRRQACSCGCSMETDLTIRAGDSKRVRLWKQHMASRRASVRIYQSKFTRVLMAARAEVIAKLESAAVQESVVGKAAAADFLFNVGNFEKLFEAAMRSAALNALQTAGDQALKELGKDDPWKVPQAEALQFVQDRKNQLSGVPQDVFEDIKGVIEQGLQDGQSLKKVAANVRAEFNDISDRRAFTIASTETSAAYGFARQEAMKAHGVQWKEWLTSGNANVRAAHRAMNGAIVGINERFLVIDAKTGETDEVLHPGDQAGAAWNVINCHCVVVMSATGPQGDAEPAE